jgi:TonB family protein
MSDNRPFHYAVAASVTLHAAVLFAFPDLVDDARRAASIPPQIIARLMEPEPAVVEKPLPPPAAERKAEKKVEKKPTPRPAKPVPQVQSDPLPQPVPAPAPPAPETHAAIPEAPPVAAIEAQPASPAQAPAAAPAETVSRDQYRVQLIDEARRHKRYPPLARENNWQGDVRVAVAVGANGRASVTLKGSSGYEVLDRQALEMFAQAARAVPVPPALRGTEFSLEVRAVYGLED